MLLVREVRLPLDKDPAEAVDIARRRLRLSAGDVEKAHIHRVSVDARHQKPVLVYTIALFLKDPARETSFEKSRAGVCLVREQALTFRTGAEKLPGPVVVCGMGPAGLFAALELARAGFAPLVLERGPSMEKRRAAVRAFEGGGALDENANIQFGEGGAGTFSDGKLTTRINDPLCGHVLRLLLDAGAPGEITWQSKPHIGTDLIQGIFERLREKLVCLGGMVSFESRLNGLAIREGGLAGVEVDGAGSIPCGLLVLAGGHSARDTFRTLADAGVTLEAKSFSVGYRIEHLQRDIEAGLYHGAAGHPALPPGEYQLNTRANGRGVYTFCMCPGGSVVAAASERGGVVTNGMSLHGRAGPNANAAVVAGVDGAEFGGDPFAAIEFQRGLERAAYVAGGADYTAPAESLGSFFKGQGRLGTGPVRPSYPRGVRGTDLGGLLPTAIVGSIREALRAFGRKLPGYDSPHAMLTGLETRTSSPVRIPRDESRESAVLAGLYPCGEGAGYAGGIMSAAVDGIRTAGIIIERYRPG